MAQTTRALGPVDRVRDVSSSAAEAFTALRRAIDEAGPLEAKYRELINLGAFATARIEGAFKTHCGRALDAGATPEEVRQAALLPLAATSGIGPVADALRWAEEVIASRR
ncbi:MAG TPA: carboxymuconolactone decarboxylase family protein [Chloroflexota bacterium]|nr:carboxymuconolactone decarboxylase family protein [Chloroflexota bacterium]